ncbi:MAG TPA: hypothetical protein VEN82_08310 [Actinomycetota bacterium]|nr:hypothetical protein [Actinomycetota bacterium]
MSRDEASSGRIDGAPSTDAVDAGDAADGPDILEEATALITAANEAGVPVRLIGGLAVRYLTPSFPPRAHNRQDLDVASVSRVRSALGKLIESLGYVPDKTFNALYGHKQLYFTSPATGRALDVLIDKLEMCHTLEFADRIERMPYTLDPTDLMLSKLQIVHLNEKDAQDLLYLLARFSLSDEDEPETIGLRRYRRVLGEDWGWWRTVTLNLAKVRGLAEGERTHLIPAGAPYDPVQQIRDLERHAEEAPKSLRWRIRAKIGERKRWYELPEETEHY